MLGQPVYFLTPDVVGFEFTGQAARRRHRHRPGAHRHRDPAQGEGGRQVRRVLRRRHRAALRRARPRDDRPTWRPSTARPWASSRSTTRPSSTSRAPAAPRTRSRPSRPTSRRRACTACRAPATIDYTQIVSLDLGTVTPSLAGPKRPQDRIEIGNVKTQFTVALQQAADRERLQPAGGAAADAPPGARPDARNGEATRRCRTRLGAAGRAALGRGDGGQQADPRRRAARGRAGCRRARRHDDRQRRRADRRHHLVHQHLEPERAARRRACWRRRRSRPA